MSLPVDERAENAEHFGDPARAIVTLELHHELRRVHAARIAAEHMLVGRREANV
jgi:hypothetical protein